MGTSLYLFVFLCLTSGLIVHGQSECCETCHSCAPGWIDFGDCFQYHHVKKTWAEAEKICNEAGGHLAHIDNKGLMVWSLFKLIHDNGRVWVGGHDLFQEGHWQWTDGSLTDFSTLWATNEPSNTRGKEHCMEINYNGGANDADCNLLKSFICSRKPSPEHTNV